MSAEKVINIVSNECKNKCNLVVERDEVHEFAVFHYQHGDLQYSV